MTLHILTNRPMSLPSIHCSAISILWICFVYLLSASGCVPSGGDDAAVPDANAVDMLPADAAPPQDLTRAPHVDAMTDIKFPIDMLSPADSEFPADMIPLFGIDAALCPVANTPPVCKPKQNPITLPSNIGSFASPIFVAVGDLDGDGWQDIIVADNASHVMQGPDRLGVSLNNGDGTFAAPVFYPVRLAGCLTTHDLNNDGMVDLIQNQLTEMVVNLSLGGGKLDSGTMYALPSGFSCQTDAVDLNCDGFIDIITPAFILMNKGDGTFTAATPYVAKPHEWNSVRVDDMDGDGWPDIVSTRANTLPKDTQLAVFSNRGGRFIQVFIDTYPDGDFTGVALGDINEDGMPDVISGNLSFLGDGKGQLRRAGLLQAIIPMLLDTNGDAHLDVVTSIRPFVELGHGDGTFDAPLWSPKGNKPIATGSGATLGDIDGDCWPDVVGVNEGSGWVAFYRNMHDGTFVQR